jgi:hypothetical protein
MDLCPFSRERAPCTAWSASAPINIQKYLIFYSNSRYVSTIRKARTSSRVKSPNVIPSEAKDLAKEFPFRP